MEAIGKLVVALVVVLVLGTGLYYAVSYTFRDFHGATLSAAVGISSVGLFAPASSTLAIAEPAFDEMGTIVYYVQQGVEVPYLFYAAGGLTSSKALEFSSESICVTSVQAPCPDTVDELKAEFGSGPVTVQGAPEEESLLVTRLAKFPA